MKYFVLLAGNGELPDWRDLTPEQQEAGMAQHDQFGEACAAPVSYTHLTLPTSDLV